MYSLSNHQNGNKGQEPMSELARDIRTAGRNRMAEGIASDRVHRQTRNGNCSTEREVYE